MGVGWEAGALAPPKGACHSTPISCRAATTAAAIMRLDREWLRGCAPHASLSERRIAYQPRNRWCNVGRIPVQRTMHRSDGLSRRKRPSGRKCVAVWKRKSAPFSASRGCGDEWWSAVTDVYDRLALGGFMEDAPWLAARQQKRRYVQADDSYSSERVGSRRVILTSFPRTWRKVIPLSTG